MKRFRHRPWATTLILIGLLVVGVLCSKAVPQPPTQPISPYGLAPRSIATYFGDAVRHQDYEISATTLHAWLKSGKPVVLVDLRQPGGPMGYEVGHIGGAHNIPLQWFGTELTATHRFVRRVPVDTGLMRVHFFPLPHHRPLVIMCYDGNGGEMTPAILRLLGYQAYGLRDGVSSWNARLNVWPAFATIGNLPLVTGSATPPPLHRVLDGRDRLGSAWASRIQPFWKKLSHVYPIGYSRPWTVDAPALWALLTGPNPPEVIDLRSPTQFAAGHITHSLNIPFGQLGSNLARVSSTRQVVLVSRTLQKSAAANAILRLLGYHSYVLKKGLVTWNSRLGTITPPQDYRIVTGPKRG